jgi:hypothetical protein
MTYDSFVTWDEVRQNYFADIHTAIFTLYVKILSLDGHSIYIYSLTQSTFCAFVVFYLARKLSSLSVDLCIAITFGLICLPQLGLMSVTVWKDVPFTLFTILGITLICDTKIKTKIWGACALGFGISFRRDGLALLVLVILCLGAIQIMSKYIKKNSSKTIFRYMMISLIISIFFNIGFPKLVHSVPDTGANFSSVEPFFQDIAYAIAVDPLNVPQEVRNHVFEVMKKDGLTGALNCGNIWSMAASKSFNERKAEEEAKYVLGDWIRTLESPGRSALLRGHMCRASAFTPFPISKGPANGWVWTNLGIDNNPNYPLKQIIINRDLTNIAESLNKFLLVNFAAFTWPGLLFTIVLFSFIFIKKLRTQQVKIFVLLITIRQFILIIISPSQEYRYAFLLYVFGYTLITCQMLNWILDSKTKFLGFFGKQYHHQK